MEKYIQELLGQNINILDTEGLSNLWKVRDDGIINLVSPKQIVKEQNILGKKVCLWKVYNESIHISYYYDGLLKGKIVSDGIGVFNSLNEYYEYYLAVMSKKGSAEYTLKFGMKQEAYYSFEEYCETALSIVRDDNIICTNSKIYEEENLKLCKKIMRIWKYNKILDDDMSIKSFNILEIILSLLPDSNLNFLDEFIDIRQNKHNVVLICQRIAGANSDFAFEKMKKLLFAYKKEMEEFQYFSDADIDPYWRISECIKYIEENRG